MRSSALKILFILMLALLCYLIASVFLESDKAYLLASIVLLVGLWTNNALPLGVVSLLPIIIFPATGILSTQSTALNYANPIIFLFLGGFLIAIAVEKTTLHQWIATKMLHLFPDSSAGIIYSLIITAGLLSSVLSNTTTTLLLLPVAMFIASDDKLKIRCALGIAYGASVGGILTPIGTPPNLILLGLMQELDLQPVGFISWIVMTAPLVLLMFLFVGFILSRGLSYNITLTGLEISSLNFNQKKVLWLIGALIILLVLNSPVRPYYNGLGLNESGILLSAGLLLFLPPFSILEWDDDIIKVPFQIIFLFGAGFAIANAFTDTGLAKQVASYLTLFVSLHVILFMLLLAAIVTFTTEITSNTALISIMLPIIYAVTLASGMNVTLFMMIATICASYAFMLPIATPPNAIVMSTGVVNVKTMALYGLLFNFAGIILIVLIANFFWKLFLT